MLCAEISLYPQKTNDASQVISTAIQKLNTQGIEYKVGSLSTHIHGTDDQVWAGIKTMFDTAKNNGEVSMVLTLSNAVH